MEVPTGCSKNLAVSPKAVYIIASAIEDRHRSAKHQSYPTPRTLKVTPHICMKYLKQALTVTIGGLLALHTFAAESPAHPLQILYLGPVSTGGGGGFGSRNG